MKKVSGIFRNSSIGLAYFTQSWILRYLGSHEEALNALQRAFELSGGSLFVLLGHARALAAAGQKAETKETLQRIFEQGERQYLSYYQAALVYLYEKENDKALRALERAFEDREGWLIRLNTEPALVKLRNEPGFINLQRKIAGQSADAQAEVRAAPEILESTEKLNSVVPSGAAKTKFSRVRTEIVCVCRP